MTDILDITRIYFLIMVLALLIERVMEVLHGIWDYLEWRLELYHLWNRKAERLRKRFERMAKSQIWTEVMDLTPLARQIRSAVLTRKEGHSGRLLIISGAMIRHSTVAALSRIVSSILGIVFCVIIPIDLVRIVNLELGTSILSTWHPILKEILSGIILGLGAEPVHNLIKTLEKHRKSRFLERLARVSRGKSG